MLVCLRRQLLITTIMLCSSCVAAGSDVGPFLSAYVSALNDHDPVALKALVSEDSKVSVVEWGVLRTGPMAIVAVENLARQEDILQWHLVGTPSISSSEEIATVVATFTADTKNPEGHLNGVWSMTLLRSAGSWRLFHMHTSYQPWTELTK